MTCLKIISIKVKHKFRENFFLSSFPSQQIEQEAENCFNFCGSKSFTSSEMVAAHRRGLVALPPPTTEEIGAKGREIESCQVIGFSPHFIKIDNG
jgi:hypothetical protein